MSAEKAPTILTRAGAQRLVARIRKQALTLDADLLRAWEGRAWEALGLESWAEFCQQITVDLAFVRLTIPARESVVLTLIQGGASERDVAAAVGTSPATIHADVDRLVAGGRLTKPEKVRGADGVLRPATVAPVESTTSVDRCGLTLLQHEAWQRLAAAGEQGLTCLELEKKARWRHGRTSGLLNRLERRGAAARPGAFRIAEGSSHAVYVALRLEQEQ